MTRSDGEFSRRLIERIDAYGEQPLVFREVKELLRVPRATAERYARRADFPAPARRSAPRVWHRHEVEAWAARMLPHENGKPKENR